MITTILFDLDGTLLPMDQDTFLNAYMAGLSKKAVSYGYDPKTIVKNIWISTGAMVQNDGSRSNEAAFWATFSGLCGRDTSGDVAVFDDFYRNEFQDVRHSCGFTPYAAETIRILKEMGFRLVLATNPLFPAIATHSRIRWAGLEPQDFELISTYENFCHAKPNPAYYQDIQDALHLTAEECVMVGNDVSEDMVAAKLGMQVFLLTDCLINKNSEDLNRFPHGSFPELLAFIRQIQT